MLERDTDLAAVFIGRRQQWQGGIVDADGRMGAARHRRQRMVVPTGQHPLQQHGEDRNKRDPAPRRRCRSGVRVLGHGFIVNGAASPASSRRRQAWVALTKLVTPTPSTANTRSRNGSPSVSRLWTGNGVAIARPATPGKANPKRPNRRKASPPHVNVRAAVVSAILRIASCGRPRRTAHAPNAAPAAAWTHNVPRPKTKPGSHPVAAEGMAGASVV